MDMILLDWTRMGRTYCLAGTVLQDGTVRVVRPLLTRFRDAPVRNAGWSAYLLDGHARWEVFELVGAQPAAAEPPHGEDLWVRSLRPCRRTASPGQRREVLAATAARPGEPLFGTALATTRAAAYLRPGEGTRSLATVVVPAREVLFSGAQRNGRAEPEVRVTLPLAEAAGRFLAVKDHHLLRRAEAASAGLDGQLRALHLAVQQMGEQVAVRLGLSRAFPAHGDQGAGYCWLMADGFFSFADPQP